MDSKHIAQINAINLLKKIHTQDIKEPVSIIAPYEDPTYFKRSIISIHIPTGITIDNVTQEVIDPKPKKGKKCTLDINECRALLRKAVADTIMSLYTTHNNESIVYGPKSRKKSYGSKQKSSGKVKLRSATHPKISYRKR